jgi:CheY-like chemotaxis protein/HPt (histidine-containing phosphotransfer) domain-containing protein
VLLVEDNEINREVAMEMIRSRGFTCEYVEDGQSAVDQFARSQYDLIFMDCQMPGVDGYEATRRIRGVEAERSLRGESGRRTPVVALTAHSMTGDRQRCLDAGMDDYLTKPIDAHILTKTLHAWLRIPAAPVTGLDPPFDPDPDHPVFDRDGLLRRCMGNEGLVDTLLDKFTRQAQADISRLRVAFRTVSLDDIRALVHRLKGASGNVAAMRVNHAALELEAAVRQENPVAIREGMKRLEHCVDEFATTIYQETGVRSP